MNEARRNPTAQAKEEGKKSGFLDEIETIKIVTDLARVGLNTLTILIKNGSVEDAAKGNVEFLVKNGSEAIESMVGSARYLQELADKNKGKAQAKQG